MPGCSNGILAVIVISCLLILGVRLSDVAVQTLAAARAFEQAGQNVGVIRIIYLLSLICILSSFCLRLFPVVQRNDIVVQFSRQKSEDFLVSPKREAEWTGGSPVDGYAA